MFVCVCVRERAVLFRCVRERETERESVERREKVCMCVSVREEKCMCVCMCLYFNFVAVFNGAAVIITIMHPNIFT